MRRAAVTVLVTFVVVVLLARYETDAPRVANSQSVLRTPTPTPPSRPSPQPNAAPPGSRRAAGPVVQTPFSVIQVEATLGRSGRLIGVRTLALSGNDSHTNELNARAEPVLREQALEAGNAEIDTVSGATYTSESWIDSLQAAIDEARGG